MFIRFHTFLGEVFFISICGDPYIRSWIGRQIWTYHWRDIRFREIASKVFSVCIIQNPPASLLIKCFVKFHPKVIVFSSLPGHFICIVKINIPLESNKTRTYIYIRADNHALNAAFTRNGHTCVAILNLIGYEINDKVYNEMYVDMPWTELTHWG